MFQGHSARGNSHDLNRAREKSILARFSATTSEIESHHERAKRDMLRYSLTLREALDPTGLQNS